MFYNTVGSYQFDVHIWYDRIIYQDIFDRRKLCMKSIKITQNILE